MNILTKRKLTKQRRKLQTCKVFECKFDASHFSKTTEEHFRKLFLEAKWFYNYCLGLKDVNDANTTIVDVQVKVKKDDDSDFITELRELEVLTGQMKQDLKVKIFSSIKGLSVLKKNGHKVGRLKFKSYVDAIPLRQIGTKDHSGVFYLNKSNNTVRIQGLKPWLKVHGLNQIPQDCEIANATLVRKASGLYINITTYQNPIKKEIPNESIGIDFGCMTPLTLSNGIKIDFDVQISKRIKKLDRKIMRRGKKKNSKNKFKDQAKRRKAYEKLTNKRGDIRKKLVSALTNSHKIIVVQDESIKAWQASGHGKAISTTGIGGILEDLKHKSETPIVVSKWFPSTQLCPKCGIKNKIDQKTRVYECSCGYKADRDLKSAKCIEREGLKQIKDFDKEVFDFNLNSNKIPTDSRELTLGERITSTLLNKLMKIDGLKIEQVNS